MYTTRIKTILAGFGRREDGTISLEAMIILPLMFWAFLSVFSIFHSYRTYTINQKAAPGPPTTIATATPPILPIPTVPDTAVATAWKWEISPRASGL